MPPDWLAFCSITFSCYYPEIWKHHWCDFKAFEKVWKTRNFSKLLLTVCHVRNFDWRVFQCWTTDHAGFVLILWAVEISFNIRWLTLFLQFPASKTAHKLSYWDFRSVSRFRKLFCSLDYCEDVLNTWNLSTLLLIECHVCTYDWRAFKCWIKELTGFLIVIYEVEMKFKIRWIAFFNNLVHRPFLWNPPDDGFDWCSFS